MEISLGLEANVVLFLLKNIVSDIVFFDSIYYLKSVSFNKSKQSGNIWVGGLTFGFCKQMYTGSKLPAFFGCNLSFLGLSDWMCWHLFVIFYVMLSSSSCLYFKYVAGL